jgi:antitoxin ParD1/3/4
MFVRHNPGYRVIVMNVSLPPELEQLVQRQVQTGRYLSASDVVREALRQMEARDQAWAFQADDIREKIAAGMASLRAGDGADGEAFFDVMDSELAELEGHTSA